MRRRLAPPHAAGLLACAISLIVQPVAAQPRQPLPIGVKAFRIANAPLPEAQLLKLIDENVGVQLQPKDLAVLAERLSI
jgi:hypothetical protein